MPALKNFYFKGENTREEKPVERKKDIPFFLFFCFFFWGDEYFIQSWILPSS